MPSPSPPRQSLCFLRHCLQQLQHGWHKHPQPVLSLLNIKGSRCNILSPPCILASRKSGQVKMFVWLKSAFHQSRLSERIDFIQFGFSHLDHFCERRRNIVFNVGKRRQQKAWHCEQASPRRSDNPQRELVLLKRESGVQSKGLPCKVPQAPSLQLAAHGKEEQLWQARQWQRKNPAFWHIGRAHNWVTLGRCL